MKREKKIPLQICDVCSKKFSTLSGLQKHKKLHDEPESFKCALCNQVFMNKKVFIKHLRSHEQQPKIFACEECGKIFPSKVRLKTHCRIHSGERPFKCAHCRSVFLSRFQCSLHERTHTGERPYCCPTCHKTFSSASGLRQHAIIHKKDAPFTCSECNKCFKQLEKLRQHQRIHSGVKPFMCDQCPRTFRVKSVLTRHTRLHSGETYRCTLCPKHFSEVYALKKHHKSRHNTFPFTGAAENDSAVLSRTEEIKVAGIDSNHIECSRTVLQPGAADSKEQQKHTAPYHEDKLTHELCLDNDWRHLTTYLPDENGSQAVPASLVNDSRQQRSLDSEVGEDFCGENLSSLCVDDSVSAFNNNVVNHCTAVMQGVHQAFTLEVASRIEKSVEVPIQSKVSMLADTSTGSLQKKSDADKGEVNSSVAFNDQFPSAPACDRSNLISDHHLLNSTNPAQFTAFHSGHQGALTATDHGQVNHFQPGVSESYGVHGYANQKCNNDFYKNSVTEILENRADFCQSHGRCFEQCICYQSYPNMSYLSSNNMGLAKMMKDRSSCSDYQKAQFNISVALDDKQHQQVDGDGEGAVTLTCGRGNIMEDNIHPSTDRKRPLLYSITTGPQHCRNNTHTGQQSFAPAHQHVQTSRTHKQLLLNRSLQTPSHSSRIFSVSTADSTIYPVSTVSHQMSGTSFHFTSGSPHAVNLPQVSDSNNQGSLIDYTTVSNYSDTDTNSTATRSVGKTWTAVPGVDIGFDDGTVNTSGGDNISCKVSRAPSIEHGMSVVVRPRDYSEAVSDSCVCSGVVPNRPHIHTSKDLDKSYHTGHDRDFYKSGTISQQNPDAPLLLSQPNSQNVHTNMTPLLSFPQNQNLGNHCLTNCSSINRGNFSDSVNWDDAQSSKPFLSDSKAVQSLVLDENQHKRSQCMLPNPQCPGSILVSNVQPAVSECILFDLSSTTNTRSVFSDSTKSHLKRGHFNCDAGQVPVTCPDIKCKNGSETTCGVTDIKRRNVDLYEESGNDTVDELSSNSHVPVSYKGKKLRDGQIRTRFTVKECVHQEDDAVQKSGLKSPNKLSLVKVKAITDTRNLRGSSAISAASGRRSASPTDKVLNNFKSRHFIKENESAASVTKLDAGNEEKTESRNTSKRAGRKPKSLMSPEELRRAEFVKRYSNIEKKTNIHECLLCGKTYKNSRTLSGHIFVKHFDGLRKRCTICDKAFPNKSRLQKHVRTHASEKPFNCSMCTRTFTTQVYLDKHVMKQHSTPKSSHSCPECGKLFKKRYSLKVHMRTHTGEKPYKCSHCLSCFATSFQVQLHQRVHTGERPYQCRYCGKCFKSNPALNLHTQRHSNNKRFLCAECGRGFHEKSKLWAHSRIHSGLHPFMCDRCPKSFKVKHLLVRHLRWHTGEIFKCGLCPKVFDEMWRLQGHTRKCHI